MTSEEMTEPEDEHERVSLKRIRNYVPGFRGYSNKDDVSDADRMLRLLISQKISLVRKSLDDCKEILENKLLYEDSSAVDFLLSLVKRLATDVGYADSGFQWLASDSEIIGEDLENLYEYDAIIMDQILVVLRSAEEMKIAAADADRPMISKHSIDMRSGLTQIEDLLRKRTLILRRTG
ncbi:MAG: hypothetical protein OEV21_01025 [Thermoplasmata archaeon]|nr:hypothetical protein [Thermoplasmata archaeon]